MYDVIYSTRMFFTAHDALNIVTMLVFIHTVCFLLSIDCISSLEVKKQQYFGFH